MTKENEDEQEHWNVVDVENIYTWPIIGKRILAERKDGFRAYMKLNARDKLWYLAYPNAPEVDLKDIKRYQYATGDENRWIR